MKLLKRIFQIFWAVALPIMLILPTGIVILIDKVFCYFEGEDE